MFVRTVARAVTARDTTASQALQQPSQPAAPQPSAGQTARARGAEERINAAYIRGAIKVRRRARMRTPSSVATSLTLRSARRLPAAGAGGWRGRPHQETTPLQAPRRISAGLYRPRYRVSEANELLRALNQPKQCRPRKPSPPVQEKTAARARALLPVVDVQGA